MVATVGQTLECGAVGDGYDRPAPWPGSGLQPAYPAL